MVLSNNKDSQMLQSFKEWKTSLSDKNVYYLNVDDSLVYDSFFNDFGPMNLAMIYRYISMLREIFKVSKTFVNLFTLACFLIIINKC
jgi:cell division cycle 14